MFKEAFKYYKTKWPTPDLHDVIDFDNYVDDPANHEPGLVNPFKLDAASYTISNQLPLPLGLCPASTWRCYTLATHPGLIVIRNPFTVRGQRYWIARSLRDYPRTPNNVNLNASLFTPMAIANWWQELQQCNDKNEARRLKISMRWATLGYHHNWDTKVYDETMQAPFPEDLSNLCKYFAHALGYGNFEAQAAIVNYYPIGTTLSGHTDHSEPNHQAPLFSFSFGQTAVFLIGGTDRELKPSALYLRSGDVLIMSQQSRLCYHAVPRVMKAQKEPWNELISSSEVDAPFSIINDISTQPLKKMRRDLEDNIDKNMILYQQVADEHFWLPFQSYLNDSRININVRQVLLAGSTQLSC